MPKERKETQTKAQKGPRTGVFGQTLKEYDIKELGNREYEITKDGVTHVGSFSSIVNIAKGQGEAGWGNP
jgi:hypothetical protein